MFAICRHCNRTTTFILSNSVESDHEKVNKTGLLNVSGTLNRYMVIGGYIGLKNMAAIEPPDYISDEIASAFKEGAICLTVECWNAAATMFRLCLDHATKPLLPSEVESQSKPEGPGKVVRRSLGLRLQWLIDNGLLPEALRDLSTCVKDDGNDGAHAGTLGKEDAEDILDFTKALLERLFTEPEKLRLAAVRRENRRKGD